MERKRVVVDNVDATVHFPVSNEKWLQTAIITSVSAYADEDKNKAGILEITFTSPNGDYEYKHQERPVTKGSNNHSAEAMSGWQLQRLCHIYNAFMGKDAHKNVKTKGRFLGDSEDNTWMGFFKAVADDFNGAKEDKPIYQDAEGKALEVWLKLTRSGDKGYLGLPFPNFIELKVEGRESLIAKGYKDVFEMPKTFSSTPTSPAGSDAPPTDW
jgi:hypothetical protein